MEPHQQLGVHPHAAAGLGCVLCAAAPGDAGQGSSTSTTSCVEPGWLPANYNDWPYFDGDSTYGALDDYSWYGDKERSAGTPSRAHKTYSCWYNHRRAVTGRLFQWSDPDDEGPGSVFTDEEVAAQGMVYSWVPAGTPVQQHLDVLYPYDPQSAVPDVTGPLTPSGSGILQVTSPWV